MIDGIDRVDGSGPAPARGRSGVLREAWAAALYVLQQGEAHGLTRFWGGPWHGRTVDLGVFSRVLTEYEVRLEAAPESLAGWADEVRRSFAEPGSVLFRYVRFQGDFVDPAFLAERNPSTILDVWFYYAARPLSFCLDTYETLPADGTDSKCGKVVLR